MKSLSTVLISIVTLVSMAMSFHALAALGEQAGFGVLSPGLPVIVDGAAAIAGLATTVLSRHKSKRARAYPWLVVAGFSGISIASNVAHASGVRLSPVGAGLLGAVPPLATLASLHLVLMLWHHAPTRTSKSRRPATEPSTAASEAAPKRTVRTAAGRAVSAASSAKSADRQAVVQWVREEVAAGRTPTGPAIADRLGGVSRKTGARIRAQVLAGEL